MSSNAMHKAERLVIGTFPVGMKPTARKGQPPSGRKRQEGRGSSRPEGSCPFLPGVLYTRYLGGTEKPPPSGRKTFLLTSSRPEGGCPFLPGVLYTRRLFYTPGGCFIHPAAVFVTRLTLHLKPFPPEENTEFFLRFPRANCPFGMVPAL